MSNLSPAHLAIIKEEEENLAKLLKLNHQSSYSDTRNQYLSQIIELRETLSDATGDDVAHLTEQINGLMQLLNLSEQSDSLGFNPLNPYFARVILEEEDRRRDLYIGTQVFSNRELKAQIVDWKASPIAALYFRYDQGEDYVEDIAGKEVEGEVVCKRMLKVSAGELKAIEQDGQHLFKDEQGVWQVGQERLPLLFGGAGTASRATNAKTQVDEKGKAQKMLPEITGLIDAAQFKLITKPDSGILAIQGTAGSGKTTVALHRIAWLHNHSPKRFPAEKMLVMVFNRALAYYISLVLPSLDTKGVEIAAFETWVGEIRNHLYGGQLPKGYAENTPVASIRLKKHPAMMGLVERFIGDKIDQFNAGLSELYQRPGMDNFLSGALKGKPFVDQLILIRDWTQKATGTLKGKPFYYSAEVKNSLWNLVTEAVEDPFGSKPSMVVKLWDELFSDFTVLRQTFEKEASAEIGPEALTDGVNWIRQQYLARQNWMAAKGTSDSYQAHLDVEDDPILLYFWTQVAGPLEAPDKKKLSYAHLFIDEAQDLSLLEHKLMLSIADQPTSLTYAGDVNQQMIEHNAFQGWKYLFDHLGLVGQEVSNLKVSYRATRQVMEFAIDLLGDLASTHDVKAIKEGPEVELFQFDHQGELCRSLSQSLKQLLSTERHASIALICHSPEAARLYYDLLSPMDIGDIRLVDDQNFSFTAGVDITDVRQVKGLEFDYVIILDADTVNYPPNSYHRYLLHIAATRAAFQLWMFNYRLPSTLLPANLIERAIR